MRVLLLFLLLTVPAAARWKAEYAKSSPEVQAWYKRQMTTPETRKRIKADWYNYCCDHADTVEAEFSKHGAQWVYRLPGENGWRTMPQDIVQPEIQTPFGKPVLFVDATGWNFGPICFFPGAAGT